MILVRFMSQIQARTTVVIPNKPINSHASCWTRPGHGSNKSFSQVQLHAIGFDFLLHCVAPLDMRGTGCFAVLACTSN